MKTQEVFLEVFQEVFLEERRPLMKSTHPNCNDSKENCESEARGAEGCDVKGPKEASFGAGGVLIDSPIAVTTSHGMEGGAEGGNGRKMG